MKQNKIDLTNGNPFGVILKFAIPVIGGNLFQLFYTLADSVIVGKTLGADSLAAVGATSIVVYFVLCFIQGMTSGFGICLGQRYGAEEHAAARKSIAASTVLSLLFSVVITALCCGLADPIVHWMKTPSDIYREAYIYMFIVLLGSGATFFYNLISNFLRAMGDSKTPLYYLVFSSLLNVVLDIVFIVPFQMGVAGAAWATVLAQLISAILCMWTGWRKFDEFHLCREDFKDLARTSASHLKIGFTMGFQMSVMCIGQLSMQSAVNALGSVAVAGYTVATKVDQVSVLVNNAMISAVSAFVSQNYGAGNMQRIRQGVRAGLIQTQALNVLMGAGILLLREPIVALFIEQPTAEIMVYSNGYLNWVAPCYLLLGFLAIYRCAVQSMGNTIAPFMACMIELVMRLGSTIGICAVAGYLGVCLASPLAWLGACFLLVPVYYHMVTKAS